MPTLLFILGGAGIAYALIESGLAVPAFILTAICIVLLYVSPAVSMWYLTALLALSIIAVLIAFWEQVLGILLGVLLTVLIVGGLIHAVEVLAK